MYKTECPYCGNIFEWEGKKWEDFNQACSHPELIQCDVCGKLMLNVTCKKCGIGGIIVPGLDHLIGKVNDLTLKPTFWMCNECGSRWEIPAEIYDYCIKGKSTLSLEEQQKIKQKVKEGKVKASGPNFKFIFMVSFVVSFISVKIWFVVTILLGYLTVLSSLNFKTQLKISIIIGLGFVSSFLLKLLLNGFFKTPFWY